MPLLQEKCQVGIWESVSPSQVLGWESWESVFPISPPTDFSLTLSKKVSTLNWSWVEFAIPTQVSRAANVSFSSASALSSSESSLSKRYWSAIVKLRVKSSTDRYQGGQFAASFVCYQTSAVSAVTQDKEQKRDQLLFSISSGQGVLLLCVFIHTPGLSHLKAKTYEARLLRRIDTCHQSQEETRL